MATVTVRGRAEEDVEPDRVRLVVAVQAESARAADALAALAGRSTALDAALDRADLLLRRPSGVTVGPVWSQQGEQTGQVARRVVTVDARADGPLGSLLAAVSTVPGGTVEQAEWVVDPGNPVHARLRAAAVRDARDRAGDYAGAAGLQVGAVEQITEPDLTGGPPRFARAMALSAKSGPGDGPVLELRLEPVTVGAEIDVRYAVLPGSTG